MDTFEIVTVFFMASGKEISHQICESMKLVPTGKSATLRKAGTADAYCPRFQTLENYRYGHDN